MDWKEAKSIGRGVFPYSTCKKCANLAAEFLMGKSVGTPYRCSRCGEMFPKEKLKLILFQHTMRAKVDFPKTGTWKITP